MLSVSQAIVALKQQVLQSLSLPDSLPQGVHLDADKVTVSLGLQLDSTPNPASLAPGLVVSSNPSHCLHHLTLEFRIRPKDRPGRDTAVTESAPAPFPSPSPETEAKDPAFAVLSEIFGTPGFDSSARASVFRETLEPLAEPQRRAVLQSLTASAAGPQDDPALGHARHLLRRLITSGPAGIERGALLLGQLAVQGSIDGLIEIAAKRWRTQSDWAHDTDTNADLEHHADTSPPRPNAPR